MIFLMTYRKNSMELEYVLLGMKFDVEFLEDAFTDEEKKELTYFIDNISKAIYIDKSYVECKENKRKSVFILESGWNSLREVILDTKFCKYMHENTEEGLIDAFVTIGKFYVYECLSSKTEKFTCINVAIKEDCEFEVIVCKDVSNDYKRYLGRWQDWEFDDDGNFLSSNADSKDTEDDLEVNNSDD